MVCLAGHRICFKVGIKLNVMRYFTLRHGKKTRFFSNGSFMLSVYANQLCAQQDIINKKDVTRPETSREYNSFNLSSFTDIQQNGYREINWPVSATYADKKIIIEYSFDGINFLPGPEVLSTGGMFTYNQYLQDTRPVLYRVRTEDVRGTVNYSGVFLP
jgi:hypothetical protein